MIIPQGHTKLEPRSVKRERERGGGMLHLLKIQATLYCDVPVLDFVTCGYWVDFKYSVADENIPAAASHNMCLPAERKWAILMHICLL